MVTKFQLGSLVFLVSAIISAPGLKFQGCGPKSSPGYFCNGNGFQRNCNTFAILRANSLYSSLSNLTYYLGITPSALEQANAAAAANDVFSNGRPILIPIDCKCDNGIIFEAQLRRTAVSGESFDEIAFSFQGLTTCDSIWEKNPKISPWNLRGRIGISVPVECACPSSSFDSKKSLLLSYPVKEGDTLAELAVEFNVSVQAIVSANNRHSKAGFKVSNVSLVPFSTLLIPVEGKPVIGFIPDSQPQVPQSQQQNPSSSKPATATATTTVQTREKDSHKKKNHKKLMLLVVAVSVVGLLVIAASVVICFFVLKYRKRQDSIKSGNWDQLKGLSLNVDHNKETPAKFDDQIDNNYSFEELQMATKDFSLSNLIEGSVYHGRLKGTEVAIKRVPSDFVSRIDFRLFDERMVSKHPNIIRFLGTCLVDGPDSFVVLEYAENGSLKDWIHGGLAIKSQFITSTNWFLTWKQRVKICLDVATALYYMHNTTNPGYVHRNIRSRNIFLDKDLNAKVGNFAMPYYEDQELGNNRGYLAPEYVRKGVVSTSIDVFAYGVVLLEVLSGKPAMDRNLVKLCDEIKQVLKSGELREWIDSALGEKYSFDGAVVMAKLARSCVEEDPFSRPGAGEIVEKLLRLVEESTVDDQFSFSVMTQQGHSQE